MEKVRIQEVTSSNWYECCMLKTSPAQEDLVLSNAVSLAQSKYEKGLIALAIYHGGDLAGFAMYSEEREELEAHWIYRLMVDERYQGMGIGRRAMELIISQMKGIRGCRRIALGYDVVNARAERLYTGLGFKHEGHFFGSEKAVILEL